MLYIKLTRLKRFLILLCGLILINVFFISSKTYRIADIEYIGFTEYEYKSLIAAEASYLNFDPERIKGKVVYFNILPSESIYLLYVLYFTAAIYLIRGINCIPNGQDE